MNRLGREIVNGAPVGVHLVEQVRGKSLLLLIHIQVPVFNQGGELSAPITRSWTAAKGIANRRGHSQRFAAASSGTLLECRVLDPVSLATVMPMQSQLIIASWQRLLRVFR